MATFKYWVMASQFSGGFYRNTSNEAEETEF